jgi:hypothetical protein
MWPFRRRRRRRERQIGEAEAYGLLHGERSTEVRVLPVKHSPAATAVVAEDAAVPEPELAAPRRSFPAGITGESLRAAFERRLSARAR